MEGFGLFSVSGELLRLRKLYLHWQEKGSGYCHSLPGGCGRFSAEGSQHPCASDSLPRHKAVGVLWALRRRLYLQTMMSIDLIHNGFQARARAAPVSGADTWMWCIHTTKNI